MTYMTYDSFKVVGTGCGRLIIRPEVRMYNVHGYMSCMC